MKGPIVDVGIGGGDGKGPIVVVRMGGGGDKKGPIAVLRFGGGDLVKENWLSTDLFDLVSGHLSVT